jgi:hypothetical protein
MSDRSNIANPREAGAHVCRLGLCAGALTLLLMTGAPAAARADAILLTTGELLEGSIVDATRNTVIIRRAIGGMRQMRIRDIADVRIDLATGEAIAGDYLGWVDGVHRVRSGDEVVRISAGRILTRERWHEEVSTEPPGIPPARALPPAQTPRPAAGPTVEPVASAAAVAEIGLAEAKRAGAARAERPSAPDAPAQDAHAGAPAAAIPTADPPAAVAPAAIAPVVVGRARVAAAPATVARAEIDPARAALGVVAAVSEAAAAEVGAAGIAPILGNAAAVTPAAAVAPAEVSPAEAGASDAASAREADSDGQLPAVSASVEPAAAGADGMIFRIELSRPAEQTVVLIYGTVDGTAVAGKDYEPQQGVVTLPLGSRSTDVRVPLIEQRRSREARFELFLTADPKVAEVVNQRISATIPAAD